MLDAPIGSTAEVDGYVSLQLAARVAGISIAEMQRITAAFAKGRAEPWCGAVLQVRTERVLGRRHRDIRIASLPEPFRWALETNRFRFLLVAEQVEPGAELGPADFMLLHRAIQSGLCVGDDLSRALDALHNGSPLVQASRASFDCLMDHFYGWGFRDDALPEVSPDYLDFLDRSRWHLGMSDRYYEAVLVELGGVDRPRRLSGAGFVRVANFLMQRGVPWVLPDRQIMDRSAIGLVHEARYQLGVVQSAHEMNLVEIAGGVLRTRDLDERGFYRIQAAYLQAGYRYRPPAPRVSGQPGHITQAQVNLIWRLWCDRGGEPSMEALDRYFGGSLAGLTSSGARRAIDELLAPLHALRIAAVQALEHAGVDHF